MMDDHTFLHASPPAGPETPDRGHGPEPEVNGAGDGPTIADILGAAPPPSARTAPRGARAQVGDGPRAVYDGLMARVNRLRDRLRPIFFRLGIGTRRRKGIVAALLIFVVVLGVLVPPLVALASALNDYRTLKSLGESGLHHLLAARDDLGDLSSLGGFLSPSGQAAPDAAYQYDLQRQSGTAYPVTVTVHPSPKLARAGTAAQQFTTTLDKNATLRYGPVAKPAPTPSPTPSPTPGAGAGGTSSGGLPDAKHIQAAIGELRAARGDFSQLRNKLNAPDWILSTAGTLPGTKTTVTTVRALADVGYDASAMAVEFVDALDPVLKRAEGGALNAQGDLVTAADLAAVQRAVTDADGYLADIEGRLPAVDLGTLPITPEQQATFASLAEQLPRVRDGVRQLAPLVEAAGWALGVGQQRNFLVQTLDRAELRATGGFTGNYGVLSLKNGKLAPFTLYNINDIEYGYKNNGYIYGRKAPAQYSWWPFANFGLRDSNLSPDFPTTARMNIDLFKIAGQGDVDGVAQFTTTAIAHVLLVTGPLTVPLFNETITADNLEAKIHYYEEDPAGIAKQQRLFPDDHTFSLRKRFTQAVTTLLQEMVKHLPQGELLPMARQFFDDLKSKEIQIYVTNQKLEDLLVKAQAAGVVDTTPGVDGYMLVQANVTVSKGTPYVAVTQTDDVTLDDQGMAHHELAISLRNNPTGPLYSIYSTYHDYVRIYVPPQARLIRATGFDSGSPLCWTAPPNDPGAGKPARYTDVPPCTSKPYPDGELSCPAGAYGPGRIAGMNDYWANDTLGPPTSTTSDLPGRGMWGGYVIVPPGCTATLKLSYNVPHMAQIPG